MAADPTLLRPLGIGDLLDELFAIYRRRFRTFVGISAVVQIPIALLSLPHATTTPGYYLFAVLSGQANSLANNLADASRQSSSVASVLAVLIVVLAVVGSVLELAAITAATSAYYVGEQPSVERSYRQAVGRFWPLVRLALLLALVFTGLVLLAVVPFVVPPLACLSFPAAVAVGVYVVVSWSLAPVALVLEDRPGALPALRRAHRLVAGAWWRTFAVLVCLAVLLAVLQLSASTLSELVGVGLQAILAPAATAQPTWIAVTVSLLASLMATLLGPLFYIGLSLLYFDRRVRVEGYDLAVQARALRQAAPTDAA